MVKGRKRVIYISLDIGGLTVAIGIWTGGVIGLLSLKWETFEQTEPRHRQHDNGYNATRANRFP